MGSEQKALLGERDLALVHDVWRSTQEALSLPKGSLVPSSLLPPPVLGARAQEMEACHMSGVPRAGRGR